MTHSPATVRRMRFGTVSVLIAQLPDAPARRDTELAAERLLLPGLTLLHSPEGAPHIEGSAMHVSVSHSRTALAVALCPDAPVGIDLETWRPQLQRVAPRVLSPAELAVYGATPAGLLQAWTLKEALYKAALTPGIDFRRDIRLPLDDKKKEATVALPSGSAKCFTILSAVLMPDGNYMSLVRECQSFSP